MKKRKPTAIQPQLSPFLRWAGSKRQLVPKLAPFWTSDHKRYIEPFMGSATLFFALLPQSAVLSDINTELVNTYVVLRESPHELFDRLRHIPKGKTTYYALRGRSIRGLPQIDRAARFLFLNRYCFNGLYRTNKKGEFNVPYSSQGTGDLLTFEELLRYSEELKRVEIVNSDFEDILRSEVQANDFVYLDPPYSVSKRRVFREYGAKEFGLADINRLAEILDVIDRRGATFLLSYAYSNEAIRAFSSWSHFKVFARRNISGFAHHRRKAAELVFTNSLTKQHTGKV